MSSLLDSFVPSRRRERRRLREEGERLSERWGDVQISAPNDGCWIGTQNTPELEWSSPSLQGSFSPSTTPSISNNSPELNSFNDKVIIVDSDGEPSPRLHADDPDKNAITIKIPLPWSLRRTHNRTPSSQKSPTTSHELSGQTSPSNVSQPGIVFKPVSDEYMRTLNDLSRGNSPVSSEVGTTRYASPPHSIVSSIRHASPPASIISSGRHASPPASLVSSVRHASPPASLVSSVRHVSPPQSTVSNVRHNDSMSAFRRSPSPPLTHDDGPNITAIMLLSPVSEDFPAYSTFSRSSRVASPPQQQTEVLRERQLPTPPPERPSTAMSSHSTAVMSDFGSSVSRARPEGSVVSTRSARGPGIGQTGFMRSSSREPTNRRAMSSHSNALMSETGSSVSRARPEGSVISTRPASRGPGLEHTSTMRSSSREPTNRRAMSREPIRRRAMTGESVIRRGQSFEALRQWAPSNEFEESGRAARLDSADAWMNIPLPHTTPPLERKASVSSSVAGSYYASLASEYRNIVKEPSTGHAPDTGSTVGRVGRDKRRAKEEVFSSSTSPQLVPSGDDLYS